MRYLLIKGIWNNAKSVNAKQKDGNTNSGCCRTGIHSYHEGGAYTDKPRNKTANEPQRMKGLFITAPKCFHDCDAVVSQHNNGEYTPF